MQTPQVSDILSPLRDALANIPLVDAVEITDIDGQRHALSTLLPAARQQQVFAAVRRMAESTQVPQRNGAPQLPTLSVPGVTQFVVELATEPAQGRALAEVFALAWPAQAQPDPLQRFPLEELVRPVVLVVFRYLRGSADAFLGALDL